jgi:hypothetical protein
MRHPHEIVAPCFSARSRQQLQPIGRTRRPHANGEPRSTRQAEDVVVRAGCQERGLVVRLCSLHVPGRQALGYCAARYEDPNLAHPPARAGEPGDNSRRAVRQADLTFEAAFDPRAAQGQLRLHYRLATRFDIAFREQPPEALKRLRCAPRLPGENFRASDGLAAKPGGGR